MGTPGTDAVTVREVGPRDGLQMARSVVLPAAAKLRWITAMAAAGARRTRSPARGA